jgi:hypothetical protein
MIRKFFILVCLGGLFFTFDTASAQGKVENKRLSKVCKSITNLPNGGYIYKNSAPIRSGGIGTPIIGYRKEPTLIFNIRTASTSGTTIYNKKGRKIGSCPWTTASGHAGGRCRCTMQTASLRRAAVRTTGKPVVFFTLRGRSCVRVPDAGRCYGSVKGLCNRTIS